jgi:hypothetical protein
LGKTKGEVSLLVACAAVALVLLIACGRGADEVPVQPLCGVVPPDSGPWRQVWRTSYDAGGVRDLVRDGDLLWAATPSDVVRLRLDTLDCTRFSHTEGDPGVPLSGVRSLMLDPEGYLWAAGREGLARYDGQNWRAVPATDASIAGGLRLDAAGNLWIDVAVDTGGIGPLRFPGHRPPQDGRWEGEVIWASHQGEGECDRWVAMSGLSGARFQSPEECRLLAAWRERLAALPPPEGIAPWWEGVPRSIAAETADRIWVLARHLPDEPKPDDALLSFDGQNWQVLSWPYGSACCLVADEARGGVWAGTNEGLVFGDGRSLQRFLLLPGDRVPFGRPIYDLVTDGNGRLWASTDWGLLLYDEPSDTWQLTEIGEMVLISADDDGGLWAVSRYAGGQVSHFTGGTWSHHPFPAAWPCTPVDAILADVGGGLWLSSTQCALRGFNGEVWDEYDSGSRGDMLARGPAGEIYAAGWDGAVKRYDGTTWETLLPANPLRHRQVTDMVARQEGEIWIALNAVPSLLVFRDGRWTGAPTPVDDPITALLIDLRGDVWAGHDQGLLHYDGETWESIESRVPFTGIMALAEDRRGRIWIGGWDGLSVYDPNGGR